MENHRLLGQPLDPLSYEKTISISSLSLEVLFLGLPYQNSRKVSTMRVARVSLVLSLIYSYLAQDLPT